MAARPTQLSDVPRDLITVDLLQSLKKEELSHYLKEHGVNFSDKKKEELVELCLKTAQLCVPSKDSDNYEFLNIQRRTVRGNTYPKPDSSIIKWSNNLRTLPCLDMFDVSQYLSTACDWTKERIQKRKQDNSYQLYSNGHIHDVQIAELGSNMMYVRARCVPETRQSAISYRLWILLESSGQIFSAECNCVAGDGSCKHVVAAIFGLLAFSTDMEDVSVTDVPAYWIAPKRICRPLPVNELDIRRDLTGLKKLSATPQDGYKTLPEEVIEGEKIEKDIVKLLKQSKLSSVALYVLSDSDSDESIELYVEDKHPLNIIDLVKQYGNENVNEHVTGDYIKSVTDMTVGQADNPLWIYQRMGRLTASNFYNALHYRGDNPNNSIVKSSLGLYKEFSTEATKYGKEYEPIAREKYGQHMFNLHTSFHCEETGLHIDQTYPFFGASPDGLISCKCCEKGVIEIKCPFKFKDDEPKAAMTKLSSFTIENGVVCLNQSENSPYYIQILGQMAVCNAPYCDFILFTQKDIYVERIQFNATLWNSVVSKLKNFYQQFILPSIVSNTY